MATRGPEGKGKEAGHAMAKEKSSDARMEELPFLPDPDAIERRPLGGVTRGVLIGLSLMLASALLGQACRCLMRLSLREAA